MAQSCTAQNEARDRSSVGSGVYARYSAVFGLTLIDPAAFFFDGVLTAFSASGSAGGTIRRSQTRQ